jgi:glycosyltransferase involved in cell wall biosynthesis
MRLSIVLPTFNERENIRPIAMQLLALEKTYDLEMIFVDDDSRDGTADEVRDLAHHYPCVRLIRRVGRNGLSSAIKEGILDAPGDVVIVMDCDGQQSRPLWQERLIHYSNRDMISLSAVVSIQRQISTASAPNGSAIQSLPMILPVIAFHATGS